MTEEDLDRVHGALLLEEKRTRKALGDAESKARDMLRRWHSATHPASIDSVTVNEDDLLISSGIDRIPLPTSTEMVEALKSYEGLRDQLETIQRKLQRFS